MNCLLQYLYRIHTHVVKSVTGPAKRLYLATAGSLYPDSCFNDHLIAIPRLWVLRPLRSLFTTKEADFEVAIPKVAIYVLTEVRQGGCGR